jgi:alkylhydroperoxidase family enzyme
MPPTAAPRLSHQDHRVLEILAAHHPRACRYSNGTDMEQRRVYWQNADRLDELGYLRHHDGASGRYVRLTDEGVARAKAEGYAFDPDPLPAAVELVFDARRAAAEAVHGAVVLGSLDALNEALASLPAADREALWDIARGEVEADADAGKRPDLLGAFLAGLLTLDPRERLEAALQRHLTTAHPGTVPDPDPEGR